MRQHLARLKPHAPRLACGAAVVIAACLLWRSGLLAAGAKLALTAANNWLAVLGGLPGPLVWSLAALAFGVSLLTVGLAFAARPLGRRLAQPLGMKFSGDPARLRGTLNQTRQAADGSYRAVTTDRQAEWLKYQAARQGLRAEKED